MCQNRGLEALIARVMRTRDVLLMKVIRNLSHWTYALQEDLVSEKMYKYKGMWAPFVGSLMELLQTENLTLEVLGTLANLTPHDLAMKSPWDKLLVEHNLVPFLSKLLVPGFSQDDVILEIVLFVGTLALEPKCAPLLKSSRMLRAFYALFQEKQHDNELTLQLLYTFYRLLRYDETFDELVHQIGIVPDLLLAADASNVEVRRMCDVVMDAILDHDVEKGGRGEYVTLICQRRFEIHNAEYLELIQSRRGYMTNRRGRVDDSKENEDE